jgi:hypothetical protein
MGFIKPPQANAARAAYHDILAHLTKKSQGSNDSVPLSDDDLLTILRAKPEMLNMLAPLLTDAQLEVVRRAMEEGGA